MSSSTLMNMRTARSFAPRLRLSPARPLLQVRGKATSPFRLPDPRNEPNVRTSCDIFERITPINIHFP